MSRIIRTQAGPHFSRAVEHHGFVFTQGVVARDTSKDASGQVEDVLLQIDELLELHGTDKSRILQAQIWLKIIDDRPVLNQVWERWLPEGQAPARAVVQAALADPAMLVEIMVTTCK